LQRFEISFNSVGFVSINEILNRGGCIIVLYLLAKSTEPNIEWL